MLKIQAVVWALELDESAGKSGAFMLRLRPDVLGRDIAALPLDGHGVPVRFAVVDDSAGDLNAGSFRKPADDRRRRIRRLAQADIVAVGPRDHGGVARTKLGRSERGGRGEDGRSRSRSR